MDVIYECFTDGAKIKVLVLNNNLYYHNEAQLDAEDPCGQLAWLRGQLEGMAENEQGLD